MAAKFLAYIETISDITSLRSKYNTHLPSTDTNAFNSESSVLINDAECQPHWISLRHWLVTCLYHCTAIYRLGYNNNNNTYKDLTLEIQRMLNVKTEVILVIIGANGTMSKSFRKYMSKIPGNMKSRDCRKQLYWALHTYFGK